MTRAEVVERVNKCLWGHEVAAGGSAHRLDADRVQGSKPESDRPPGTAWSSYDTAVRSLLKWCEQQEHALKTIQKGPNKQPESEETFASRVRSYEGLTNKQIAQIERTSESRIQKIRVKAA